MSYPTHGPEYHERDSWKRPCRVATTANVTISTALNAGDTIDGVTLAAGDRVLVKDQTAPEENGIYVAGASPARAIDFASEAEIVGGAVIVTEGTANGGKAWLCDTPAPIVVDTDPISFTGFGSGGGADPHITGTGTGFIDFPAGMESIRALMPGNVAGLQLEDTGYAMLFAGILVNAYVYVSEALAYLSNNAGEFRLDESTGFVRMRIAGGTVGVNLRTDEQLAMWAEHAATDLSNKGLNIEVGEDYVGLYISEKDPDTIQVYDDSGGAYDIEFVEQDAARHFKFVHPDGGVAIPALGMLPQYASAPHAGVEQERESYYDETDHVPRYWDGSAWQDMAGPGGGTVPDFADNEVPSGTINGSNAAFTLAHTPSPSTSLHLYRNGLRLRAGAGNDYTLTGDTITYEAGNEPATGDTHLADYRY